jgi:hypothetical protein
VIDKPQGRQVDKILKVSGVNVADGQIKTARLIKEETPKSQ